MRTRFAPAPTGYLHLGHIANALYVWGMARERKAAVVLRVEDHDRQRCRPEYERALLDDLDWLGLVPDVATTAEFRRGASPYRQSNNSDVYAAHVERLRARGHQVYACDCSRRTEAMVAGDPGDPMGRPYTGHCRTRNLAPGPGRGLRVVLADGPETFHDLRLGVRTQLPARQCGDLLLMDRLGNWTYQFAVVVDDLRQGIDLVVRGEDLLEATGRQIQLARLLGRTAPVHYLHHPLIVKPGGEKLSKGSGDTSVRDLRAAGQSREGLFGRAVAALGLAPEPRPLSLAEALAIVQHG